MVPITIKGITVHNTNNELSAKENLEIMQKLNAQGEKVSVHFFVDSQEVIQATDLSLPTWHTGKGKDMGNMNTISIEICTKGDEEECDKAENKAIDLIKELLREYKLSTEDIYFHRDFDNSFYCPCKILDRYKLFENPKKQWIKEKIEKE